MSTRKAAAIDIEAAVNEVRLVGRLSRPPEERVLPSGDAVWTFRVVVPRSDRSRRPRPKRSSEADRSAPRRQVDALECAAWSGRAQRAVRGWQPGDVVEVAGALHRRFYRTGGGAVASRVEVEMTSGRVIRRAAAG